MTVSEAPKYLWVVPDRRGIDHPYSKSSGRPLAGADGPRGEIGCERHDLSSVGEDRIDLRANQPATTKTIEQWHADPTLEFGEPLGEGRRADPDLRRG